jgi:hypothetical protein
MGIGGATCFAGDAIFQLLPVMAPLISLDLGDGPMNQAVAPHRRSAVFIELTSSRRNQRNSLITTTPTRTHSELHGIGWPEAARAPRQWPRRSSFIVASGNRLRIDIFLGFCRFPGHSNHMGWPSTNYESN